MAPLPVVRAQMSLWAFSNISVDFAGTFLIKQGRKKTKFKSHLCPFACMNTCMAHLDIAYGLDTILFSRILQNDHRQRISCTSDI